MRKHTEREAFVLGAVVAALPKAASVSPTHIGYGQINDCDYCLELYSATECLPCNLLAVGGVAFLRRQPCNSRRKPAVGAHRI